MSYIMPAVTGEQLENQALVLQHLCPDRSFMESSKCLTDSLLVKLAAISNLSAEIA